MVPRPRSFLVNAKVYCEFMLEAAPSSPFASCTILPLVLLEPSAHSDTKRPSSLFFSNFQFRSLSFPAGSGDVTPFLVDA